MPWPIMQEYNKSWEQSAPAHANGGVQDREKDSMATKTTDQPTKVEVVKNASTPRVKANSTVPDSTTKVIADAPKESETLTPYGFAREVNKFITADGGKELPPQMFYTYARKGMFKDNRLTIEYAAAWYATYKENKAKREAAREEKLKADLEGKNDKGGESHISHPDVSTEEAE